MSKYVNETGDGYLGVGAVSESRSVGFGVGMFPVEWDGNTVVWAIREEPGVAIVEAEPDEYLAQYNVSKGWRNSPGPSLSLGGRVLDALDVEAGDDVRAYEREEGGLLLVPADPDPFVEGDDDS